MLISCAQIAVTKNRQPLAVPFFCLAPIRLLRQPGPATNPRTAIQQDSTDCLTCLYLPKRSVLVYSAPSSVSPVAPSSPITGFLLSHGDLTPDTPKIKKRKKRVKIKSRQVPQSLKSTCPTSSTPNTKTTTTAPVCVLFEGKFSQGGFRSRISSIHGCICKRYRQRSHFFSPELDRVFAHYNRYSHLAGHPFWGLCRHYTARGATHCGSACQIRRQDGQETAIWLVRRVRWTRPHLAFCLEPRPRWAAA